MVCSCLRVLPKRFAFLRAAGLLRDVPEKAEDRPCWAYWLASGELRHSVAFGTWLAAADWDDLRFFTPIT